MTTTTNPHTGQDFEREDFTTGEGLRALLHRLHTGGEDAWVNDPVARDLMEFAAEKYKALARKHRLDTWEAVAAAFDAMKKGKKPKPRPKPRVPDDAPPVRYPVRAFVQTWGELASWWTHYDIDVLAVELTDDQYENFLTVAEATARFAGDLRTTREAHAAQPILRAL